MTRAADPLKEKIDALALAILNEVTGEDGKIVGALPQSVVKAMDVVKTLGQWFAIKNKVPTDGDEEGSGIDEYQKRLGDQAGAGGGNPTVDGGADNDEPTTAAADDLADIGSARDTAEPERDGSAGGSGKRSYRQARAPGGGFGSGRGDADNGGPELARFMASLPGNAGRDVGHQHDSGGKSGVVRGGRHSGSPRVEDAGEPDLDNLVG